MAAPELSILQWLEQQAEVVAVSAAASQAGDPALKSPDALIHALQRRIADLEATVAGYVNSQALNALFSGPLREVMVVKKGATDKQFQQRLPENGVLVDFVDGLAVTSDSDPGAAITLAADHVCILRAYDADANTVRNIIISGSTAADQGQYQYQIKSMIAQNSTGWDPCRASPPFPP